MRRPESEPVVFDLPRAVRQPEPRPLAGDALREFLAERSRPWHGVPVPFSSSVTIALWCLLLANAGFGVWLVAVLRSAAVCAGPVCGIGAWGHPQVVAALAGVSLVALSGAALFSRGLTRAGAIPMAAVVAGTVCGVVALSGLLVLMLLVLAAAAVALTVLAVAVERV